MFRNKKKISNEQLLYSFLYNVKAKNFGVIQKILKIFDFETGPVSGFFFRVSGYSIIDGPHGMTELTVLIYMLWKKGKIYAIQRRRNC